MIKRILAGAMAFGLLAGTGASAQSTGALTPVKVMTSLPTLTSATAYDVLAQHFDNKHGLSVEMLQAGGNSALMIDAVLSGAADFGTPGTPTALQAIREGANLIIIAGLANNTMAGVISNEALKKLNVSPNAPIADRIRAMKGMTIACNPVGSTYYQMWRAYLMQYGLNPDRDVRLVPLADSNALINGIEQGRFDAVVTASGVVEQAIGLKAATLWFSGPRGDLAGKFDTLTNVVITRPDTLEKRPELVRAYLAALQDSLNALHNDREASGAALKTQFFPKLDPQLWDLVWSLATKAYPNTMVFPRSTFNYWLDIDPKGAASFKNVDYDKIVYKPAQAP
jgi:NitT/TauT family transport system substrate-binding protein